MLSSSVWRGNARWWFSGGLLLGGVTTGFTAVVLGSLIRPVIPPVVATGIAIVVLVVIAGQEFGLYRLPLPQNARQVPQSIVGEDGRVGGLQFGFEMGTGLRTFMTSGLPHVALTGVLLFASWPHALLVGLGFGAGRAWMALSRLWHGDHNDWDAQLVRWDRVVRMLLTVAAAAALWAIVR